MKKSVSKQKSNIKKAKPPTTDNEEYAQFLEKKINQQQYLTHLINRDASILQTQNETLKSTITKLRKSQQSKKQKITELQEHIKKQNLTISKLSQRNQFLSSKIQRLQQQQKIKQTNEPLETKIVFKQFLNNTFPTYKDTIKRLLRFFMLVEKHSQSGVNQRIKSYNQWIKVIVQKIMLMIFPKKQQNQKVPGIAETIVSKWKQNEMEMQKQLQVEINLMKNKQIDYLQQIQGCEAQLIRMKAAKSMLQGKVSTYEKSMKVKAAQFVVHFKKALASKSQDQQQVQVVEKMNEILHILQTVVHSAQIQSSSKGNISSHQHHQVLGLSNKSLPGFSNEFNIEKQGSMKKLLKKAAPILKKNIYGYYQQPQLSTQWNFLTLTRHPDLNKQTQTLPDDLTILITRPVLLLHLFDGNIRPQRSRPRPNIQFYIKIHKNSQQSIDSSCIISTDYLPIWNRQYLLKNYDFPYLKIQLMNKSKGLRDKSIGDGKLLVQSSQSKIVNVRRDKQYQGRIRFGIFYIKGNIYEFVVNSVQLIVPENVKILSQIVQLSVPMNQSIVVKFGVSNLINYLTNASFVIVPQIVEESMKGIVCGRKLQGTVLLKEFTQREGAKRVVIQTDQGWQIIIDGYVVLVISEQSQPERILCQLEDKFIAVRAGYPLVSASYHNEILYSHVKLPLVYKYEEESTCLSCVLQSEKIKGKTQETILDPLILPDTETQVVKHELLSTPPHVYKFFIETIEGPQVKFSYQSLLFVKLLDKIKLQIDVDLNKTQNLNKNDPFLKKGKRVLGQNQNQDSKIQFFIQTKDLMPNFYKVLSKTYKLSGYSKYKIGYCKIKNLLTTQGQQKIIKKPRQKRDCQIDQPLKGQYYVSANISKGYLPAFTSASKYSVEIVNKQNEQNEEKFRTSYQKGHLASWNHKILLKLKFTKDTSPKITLKLYQSPLIGSQKIIYQSQITITKNILKLGAIVLNISSTSSCTSSYPQQNILILDNIKIPSNIYSLFVSDIEVQVQQQADWFSKNDLYTKFYLYNKQVFKTKTIDSSGDNASWDNINFKCVVEESEAKYDQRYQLFKCKIFDQDLINDDYLGQGSIQFDPEIANSQSQIQCIRASIVKDEKICGGIRMHGKFKRIRQQPQKLLNQSFTPLNPIYDKIYQLCLTQIKFHNSCLHIIQQQQKIKIQYQSKQNYKSVSKQLIFKTQQQTFNNVNFSLWHIIKSSLTIDSKQKQKEKQREKLIQQNKQKNKKSENNLKISLFKEEKSLFKAQHIQIGFIELKQSQISTFDTITNIKIFIIDPQSSKQIGYATILIQPIYQSNYCVIDAYTSGTSLQIQSIQQSDSLLIQPTTSFNMRSLQQDFQDMYLISNQDYLLSKTFISGKQLISAQLKLNEKESSIQYKSRRQIFYNCLTLKNHSLNNEGLTVLNIHNNNSLDNNLLLYRRQFEIKANALAHLEEVNKIASRIYKIKILHFEPVKFKSNQTLRLEIEFSHKNSSKIKINYKMNEVFNSYYAFDSSDIEQNRNMPMLFSSEMMPTRLTVAEVNQCQESINTKNNELAVFELVEKLRDTRDNSVFIMPSKFKYVYAQKYGALYYELEEFKEKYRKIYFNDLFIRFYSGKESHQEDSKSNYEDNRGDIQNVIIGLSQSQVTYCQPKSIGKNGFYFQNVQFFIPIENTTNKLTLKVVLQRKALAGKSQAKFKADTSIKQYQIQLKGKNNKWDYIYLQTPQYLIHSTILIQSDLSINNIQRVITPPTPISFIQLQSLTITPSQHLFNNELIINFSLHNQFIQLKAIKSQQSSDFSYEMNQKQLLYIYQGKESIVKVEIIQERIFGNKVLELCHILIKKQMIAVKENKLYGQIRNQDQVVLGRVEFKYKALEEVKYLYVDIDKIIPKYKYQALNVQLVPFGCKKLKTQRIQMRLLQNNLSTNNTSSNLNNNNNTTSIHPPYLYDTSQDLILCQNDYQDYSIHLSNSQTQQLLAKFKLCDLVKKGDSNDYEFISAIHPLRVDRNSLFGLMSINYIEYVSKRQLEQMVEVDSRRQFVKVVARKFKFHRQNHETKISFNILAVGRKLFTRQAEIRMEDFQNYGFSIILPYGQKFNLIIQSSNIPIAYSIIQMKQQLIGKNQQLIVFKLYSNSSQVYGIGMMQISECQKQEKLYELQDVWANNLEDMELLVKMNPYIVVEADDGEADQGMMGMERYQKQKMLHGGKDSKDNINVSKSIQRSFVTQLTQGSTNLYWTLGHIINTNTKLTLFDKDMKFDDYIGECVIDLTELDQQFISNSNSDMTSIIKKPYKLISKQQSNDNIGGDYKQSGEIIAGIKKLHSNIQPKQPLNAANQQLTLQQQTKRNILKQDLYILCLDGFNINAFKVIKNSSNKRNINGLLLTEDQYIDQIRIYLSNSSALQLSSSNSNNTPTDSNCIYSRSLFIDSSNSQRNINKIKQQQQRALISFQNVLLGQDNCIILDNFIFNFNNRQQSASSKKQNDLNVLIQLQIKSKKPQNQGLIKMYKEVIELNKLYRGQMQMNISKDNKNQQSKQQYKIFQFPQLIPLSHYLTASNKIISQQIKSSKVNKFQQTQLKILANIANTTNPTSNINQVFLIKSIYLWFDYMYFNSRISLIICIKHIKTLKVRQYSLELDISSMDYKNGLHLIHFEVQKYLKHSIWVQKLQTIQILAFNRYQYHQIIDKCFINLSQEKQFNYSNKFIIQSDLIRKQKTQMYVGKLYLELDKIIFKAISNSSTELTNFNSIIQNSKKSKISSLRWIQINIKSAKFLKDIQWISKMDPYCQIQYENQYKIERFRTATRDNVGTQPVWNQTFFLPLRMKGNVVRQQMNQEIQKQIKTIKLTFMDEEVTLDRCIGYKKTEIQIGQLQKNSFKDYQVELTANQKDSQIVGKGFFSCKLISSCIIFTDIKSPLYSLKQLDLNIFYQGKLREEKQKQKQKNTLELCQPYPLTNDFSLKIKAKGQSELELNLLIAEEKLKVSNVLYFEDIKVGLQFIILK